MLPSPPGEGELYRRVRIGSRTFDVFYGYYEDFEREQHDPIPLYPDLLREHDTGYYFSGHRRRAGYGGNQSAQGGISPPTPSSAFLI